MSAIKIFSWNVNGIRAVIKKGALQDFLAQHQPDILLLQETKINPAGIEFANIPALFPEYTQFYSSAQKPGYSGTAIWLKAGMGVATEVLGGNESIVTPTATTTPPPPIALAKTTVPLTAPLADAYGNLLEEGRLTILELPNFYAISVYVPNAKSDLSRLAIRQKWDQHLARTIAQLQQQKPVVIGGDFNVAHQPIDLARPAANVGKHGYTTEERAGFDQLLKTTATLDTFRTLHPDTVKYSWWSHWGNARANNTGWRIDYLLASKSLAPHIKKAEIYPEITGSDHCPIMLELDIEEKV